MGIEANENGAPTGVKATGNVNIQKVYEAKIRPHYAALLNEIAPKKLEDVVAGLEKYVAGLGKELSRCEECSGFWSEEITPACPYCGSAAEPSTPTELAVRDESSTAIAETSQRWDTDEARRAVDEVNARYEAKESESRSLGKLLVRLSQGRVHELLGYRTWVDFLDAEIHVPKTTAYRMMSIALDFTDEEFTALGVGRANELLRLPEERRAELVEEAKGLSVRKLRERVATILRPAPRALPPKKTAPVVIRLPEGEGTIAMTSLGESIFVGAIPGIDGALQLIIRPDEDGDLELLVTPIGGAP